MKGLIKDLGMAAQVFGKAREARRQGAVLKVQEAKLIPVYNFDGWGATMEGSLFASNSQLNTAMANVYNSFSPQTRRMILNHPRGKNGWVERAKFWREQLKPVLPPKMYHETMIRLCSWYRRCIHMRKRGQE